MEILSSIFQHRVIEDCLLAVAENSIFLVATVGFIIITVVYTEFICECCQHVYLSE